MAWHPGTREMPVWGEILDSRDEGTKSTSETANLRIVNIGHYLETIQVK